MRTLIILLVLCGAAQAQRIKTTKPGGQVITKHLRDRSIYYRPYRSIRLRNKQQYDRFIRNNVRLQVQIRKDLTDTNKIIYRFRNGTLLRRTKSGKAYVDYTPVWGTLGMRSYYRGILKD
jgi:hypothetical protein